MDNHAGTLAGDIAAFEAMQTELERDYMGKWVLFHQAAFIDAFDSLEKAAETAVARFGRGPYLIREVGAPPRIAPASIMYHRLYARG